MKTTNFFAITNSEELDIAHERLYLLESTDYLSDDEWSERDALTDEIKRYERTIGREEE